MVLNGDFDWQGTTGVTYLHIVLSHNYGVLPRLRGNSLGMLLSILRYAGQLAFFQVILKMLLNSSLPIFDNTANNKKIISPKYKQY